MSRSCVCGGENENCRYCGGSGIVADRLGTALNDALSRVTIENSPTEDIKAEHKRWPSRSQVSRSAPVRWVRCPKGCGRWVNILDGQKVEKHLRKCTGVRIAPPEKAPAPQSNPEVKEISFDSCPLCGVRLRATRVQRHMSKAHATSTSNPLFGELVRRANHGKQHVPIAGPVQKSILGPGRERTPCPVCKVTVNVGRLKKHMAKVHKQRVQSRPAKAASAKDPTRQNTILVAPRDKNLDSTKLYAHPYREQGRYGSHPSHDGFDDESSPE